MEYNDFLELFIEESKEHLQSINDELLKLEAEPENLSIVNEIFRSAHTLKGMSASMGFEDLASLTHEMENVLDLVRNAKLTITNEIMDVIFQCVDLIEKMIDSIEQGGDGKADVTEVVRQLTMIHNPSSIQAMGGQALPEVAATAVAEEFVLDTFEQSMIEEAKKLGNKVFQIKISIDPKCVMKSIRAYMVFQAAGELGEIIHSNPSAEDIEAEKFDDSFTILLLSEHEEAEIQSQFNQISELTDVLILERTKQALTVSNNTSETVVKQTETTNKAEAAPASVKKKHKSKSIRVDIEKLDQLMNLFSELIIDRGRLELIARKAEDRELTDSVEHMTRITTDLQGLILNMRMVQVDQVFNRFPRMIRDLAKDLKKKIQLVVEGEETELDRTVIDEIGDPLVHLLRNALDHGLESTEERLASGKSEEGKITLKAYHSGNSVFIEVADDGKGINRDKVLNKALERGVVTQKEADSLTDQQVFALLFSSGFSTADKISDISGRGVGLDVVKTKIESLSGEISIDSVPGHGSTFRIQLPLTLSIINAMLIKAGEETYAIPFSSILEITEVSGEQVTTLYGQKVIQFRDQVVSLVEVNDIFKVPTAETDTDPEQQLVVIARKGDKLKGLVVDSVIGQQEVVLKSLGNYLTNLFAISGATILGTGEVALIMDTNQLFN
ncbi:chemotaxis protein CheA [Neobacillus sp. MM2021_6]|uniref:chemotaxis protein CheA n=1 Tax=Bacillaceae TaxID=186817 RepID=UPI00140849DE|nr:MULTISPECIES: chemotaxis protein CheA [Bacillaceae]MBO0962804.1 chemotaxis protein CheA [Neobacillus sp. MM2021_6]NHC21085.1 chemotaxis protein CheA [Bacillus sp. MM2020_4]